MKYRYSIVIPMYNSENTILNSIKSVLKQSNDIEIVIIDDGSEDLSSEVVLQFIRQNNLSKIINYYKISHQGISVARNIGISKCHGDYFIFLDSDDELVPNSIVKVDNYLKQYPVDLLKCSVQCVENKEYDCRFDLPYFDNIDGLKALLYFCESNRIFATPWSYVINRENFCQTNLSFLENTLHEDYGMMPILIFNSPTVSSNNIELYKYIKRENSAVTKNDYQSEINRMNDFILHTYNLVDLFLKSNILQEDKIKIVEYFYKRLNIKYNHLDSYVKENINFSLKGLIDKIIVEKSNNISIKIDSILKKYKYINFPLEYKITIKATVQLAINQFKDNLSCIILGGSGGKNEIVVGCSDIDIYIILNKYVVNEVVIFTKKLEKFKIHIGLTVYSKNEFNTGWIDGKTKVMLYEKQNYQVNPTLYGKIIKNKIDYSYIVQNDTENLPNVLHECRRLHIDIINNKVSIDKKYLKKLLVLIKCFLNTKRIFSFGYERVLNDLKKYLKEIGKINTLTKIADFDIIYAIKNPIEVQHNILFFGETVLALISEELKEDKQWKKE